MSLLSLKGVTASYGPVQALFGVDLDLHEGKAMALLGRNGMGKSTTVNAICGLVRVDAGTLRFTDKTLNALPAHRIARLGIGIVPEGRRCFAPLTVRENLVAAARKGPWDLRSVTKFFPRLGERLGQRAGTLSGGEQQMLAIGRALMTNPRLLLLDEATEGLAPLIRAEIWSAVEQLKSSTGLTLLIVDKSLRELEGVADQCTVLERGRSVWSGPFANLTPDIVDRYLGV